MVTFTPIYSYCRKKKPQTNRSKGYRQPPLSSPGFLLYRVSTVSILGFTCNIYINLHPCLKRKHEFHYITDTHSKGTGFWGQGCRIGDTAMKGGEVGLQNLFCTKNHCYFYTRRFNGK